MTLHVCLHFGGDDQTDPPTGKERMSRRTIGI